mmetsp:Transcript_22837/g.26030  ORF Transcript_22837/g.26030 Transcript_22837/m.26030 type:complete len:243 (-) Transcript_22837:28-756(-)
MVDTKKKNVPYTRGGDNGTSQLLTGERRSKDDIVFEAMGTVDELCAVVGVAHAQLLEKNSDQYGVLPDYLLDIMSRLFDVGSHVAKPRKITYDEDDDEDRSNDDEAPLFVADGVGGGFHIENVEILEQWIDEFTEELPELTTFVLPTGSMAAAQFHVARTVCRRAERQAVGLVQAKVCDPNTVRYLNRLSDFFFTAARYANYKEDKAELAYCKPKKNSTQRERYEISSAAADNDKGENKTKT